MTPERRDDVRRKAPYGLYVTEAGELFDALDAAEARAAAAERRVAALEAALEWIAGGVGGYSSTRALASFVRDHVRAALAAAPDAGPWGGTG